MEKQFLTTAEAADYLGVSTAFLERDRRSDVRYPFVRIGKRAVRYKKRILDEITDKLSGGGLG